MKEIIYIFCIVLVAAMSFNIGEESAIKKAARDRLSKDKEFMLELWKTGYLDGVILGLELKTIRGDRNKFFLKELNSDSITIIEKINAIK